MKNPLKKQWDVALSDGTCEIELCQVRQLAKFGSHDLGRELDRQA
jgi:hypothetical protein